MFLLFSRQVHNIVSKLHCTLCCPARIVPNLFPLSELSGSNKSWVWCFIEKLWIFWPSSFALLLVLHVLCPRRLISSHGITGVHANLYWRKERRMDGLTFVKPKKSAFWNNLENNSIFFSDFSVPRRKVLKTFYRSFWIGKIAFFFKK